MTITKLQAAQGQLDCAIRLLLKLDDLSSVITLSRAAFRILFDIYPVLRPDADFGEQMDSIIRRMGWPQFNKIANQLKHADKDADAVIDPNPIHAMVGIGLAVILHRQITGTITSEMQAFETIMTVLEPDTFAKPLDPDSEGYADFVKAVEHAKNATHEQLMEFGRGALHYLKTGENLKKDPFTPSS